MSFFIFSTIVHLKFNSSSFKLYFYVRYHWLVSLPEVDMSKDEDPLNTLVQCHDSEVSLSIFSSLRFRR